MTMRWIFAVLHLLALGIGLGAVWARGLALKRALDRSGFQRVFYADTWWGVAAILWLATGLVRLFAGLEKGRDYYFHNHFFMAKMTLLVVIFALEVPPMVALTRWRVALRKGTSPDTHRAGTFATISYVQTVLVVLMVVAATAMARGYGS